jgi:hypothetical protein
MVYYCGKVFWRFFVNIRKSWGDKDRQAFADRNILRASTIPDGHQKRSKASRQFLKREYIREYLEEC